jgi:zinc transport system ATP-binding protein
MGALLTLKNISLTHQGRNILHDVSIDVGQGQIVTLIGPSGAGKTSLVRIALGLLKPSAGESWRAPKLRIGYVPQKVVINQLMPLSVHRFLETTACEESLFTDTVRQVGITHLLSQRMNNLSGGEMQRVLLAKALLNKPQLLVLDEPVQGVDVTGQAELYQLIQDLSRDLHCAVLMVSHDLHLVMSATDTVVCLNTHICCTPSLLVLTLPILNYLVKILNRAWRFILTITIMCTMAATMIICPRLRIRRIRHEFY